MRASLSPLISGRTSVEVTEDRQTDGRGSLGKGTRAVGPVGGLSGRRDTPRGRDHPSENLL